MGDDTMTDEIRQYIDSRLKDELAKIRQSRAEICTLRRYQTPTA
jgi:hypothetical protein